MLVYQLYLCLFSVLYIFLIRCYNNIFFLAKKNITIFHVIMKLYCFVIVFISVIFTVSEGEWGNGGIRGVNSLPIPSTNQNKAISPYSQPLTKRLLLNKRLQTTTDY